MRDREKRPNFYRGRFALDYCLMPGMQCSLIKRCLGGAIWTSLVFVSAEEVGLLSQAFGQ